MSRPIRERFRLTRDRFRLTRDRLIQAGLAVALLAGVVAVTSGVGYRSSQAVLGNASTYLQKGRTVVRVNAASGVTDAKSARDLAPRRRKVEVVQVGPDRVYVVNNDTQQTWLLPTDTMRPVPVAGLPGAAPANGNPSAGPAAGGPAAGGAAAGGAGAGGAGAAASGPASANQSGANQPGTGQRHLVAGGGAVYVLDAEQHTLALLAGAQARVVDLHGVDDVVVDSSGTAWALSRADGKLYTVVGGDVRGELTVCVPNEPVRLTLADDRPVVYIPERGIARMFGRDVAHPETPVAEQPGDGVRVAAPGADAAVLVTVVPRDDKVIKVDFRTGIASELRLTGREGTRSYGQPVVLGNRVYVPDYTRQEVVTLKLDPLQQLQSVPVPGTDSSFDVTVHDDRVWVHNPYSRVVLSFDRDGHVDNADLGPGDGVEDPDPSATKTTSPPKPKSTPSRSASARPSPKPSRTTSPPPPPVEVPPVQGKTEAEACGPGGLLPLARLRCAPPATRQDPGCQTGKAVGSTPAVGARVPANTVVTVFYCGPTTVPGPLAGAMVDAACQTVEAADLTCDAQVGGVATNPADMGKVIGQNPPATTSVPRRSAVTVTYLRKDVVEVPSVLGMDPGQACASLRDRGFDCLGNDVPHWDSTVQQQNPGPGTPAPARSAVQISYAFLMPSVLHRYKAPGEEARYLSLGGGPGGWSTQSDLGGVYPNTVSAPYLVDVHQFSCSGSCGSQTVGYFYKSALNSPTPDVPPNSRWQHDGVAFKCLTSPQQNTRPLYGLFKQSLIAWAFAPQDSSEYQTYISAGYVPQPEGPICHIWFGAPGFRPSG